MDLLSKVLAEYNIRPPANAFVPKLSFAERCQIYALVKRGLSRKAVAAYYRVHIVTVHHVMAVNSKHYRRVREEYNALGDVQFSVRYFNDEAKTKEILAFIEAWFKERSSTKPPTHNRPLGPNRAASSRAGVHQFMHPTIPMMRLHFDVQWRVEEVGGEMKEGWYANDLVDDGTQDGEFWQGPHVTSTDAYNHMLL